MPKAEQLKLYNVGCKDKKKDFCRMCCLSLHLYNSTKWLILFVKKYNRIPTKLAIILQFCINQWFTKKIQKTLLMN